MRDIITEIWSTARKNKLRTTLTGFAVAWGIFMIIVLLGAGNGLVNAQLKQSDRFLSSSMVVYGGVTSKPYQGMKEGRTISLQTRDISTTDSEFKENIDEVGAQYRAGATISLGQQYITPSLAGVYPNHIKIDKVDMILGRFINDNDIKESRKVIIVSNKQAKELLNAGSDKLQDISRLVGRYVNVGGLAFKVVGIYKENENGRADAFSSYTAIKRIYGANTDNAGRIEFTFHGLPTEAANEAFEKEYRQRLNASHQAHPEDESAIWLWNRFTQNLQMQTGIKPWSILKLIIIESVIITTFFGYIGMLLGIFANEYMDATLGHETIDTGIFKTTMFVDPTVGLDVCIEATMVMIVAGTFAGLIPAFKASRIRPIEALRAD